VSQFVYSTFGLNYADRWDVDVPVLVAFFFFLQFSKALALQFVTWDTK
jgi:hypothetical protein